MRVNARLSFRRNTFVVATIIVAVFVPLSIIVGTRDFAVGSDTIRYASYFHSLDYQHQVFVGRFEPLFQLFSEAIAVVTNEVWVYFAAIFLFVSIAYAAILKVYADKYLCASDRFPTLIAFFGCLLFSSWFLVGTVNGLRQGMGLVLFYNGVLLGVRRKHCWGVVLIAAAAGFHSSVLLAVPFVPLLFLRARWVYGVFFAFAVSYYLGVNEKIVELLSQMTGLPLYSAINAYAGGVDRWRGFQLNFVVYSVFWLVLALGVGRAYGRTKSCIAEDVIVKLYAVMTLPYFLLGFGSYSNRFAIMGWFLVPAMQAVIFGTIRLRPREKLALSCGIFGVGSVFYTCLFLTPFLRQWMGPI